MRRPLAIKALDTLKGGAAAIIASSLLSSAHIATKSAASRPIDVSYRCSEYKILNFEVKLRINLHKNLQSIILIWV